jgi:hypothetical protein
MPYEKTDVTFHCNAGFTGRVSKWGSRVLGPNPQRIEFDLLLPSQTTSMFCVRVTVYDPGDLVIGKNDYVKVLGKPTAKDSRVMLIAFGKDVKILNKWRSKNE